MIREMPARTMKKAWLSRRVLEAGLMPLRLGGRGSDATKPLLRLRMRGQESGGAAVPLSGGDGAAAPRRRSHPAAEATWGGGVGACTAVTAQVVVGATWMWGKRRGLGCRGDWGMHRYFSSGVAASPSLKGGDEPARADRAGQAKVHQAVDLELQISLCMSREDMDRLVVANMATVDARCALAVFRKVASFMYITHENKKDRKGQQTPYMVLLGKARECVGSMSGEEVLYLLRAMWDMGLSRWPSSHPANIVSPHAF